MKDKQYLNTYEHFQSDLSQNVHCVVFEKSEAF